MSGILINDNSTAVEAYNNLDATSDMLSSAVNKLSSGLQIQTAADDPAGYLVGQYLQEESNGYGQSISNAQDAVSVLQTAQGALNQEASVLQTMNTLATEAANGGVQDASTSAAAQSEFASLQAELDQIATSTTYGTTPLLGGTYSGETFQVGPYDSANDQVVVTIAAATSTALAVNTTAVSIGSVSAAEAAMTAVQTCHLHGGQPGRRRRCHAEPDSGSRLEPDHCAAEHRVGARQPGGRQRGAGDGSLHLGPDPRAVGRGDPRPGRAAAEPGPEAAAVAGSGGITRSRRHGGEPLGGSRRPGVPPVTAETRLDTTRGAGADRWSMGPSVSQAWFPG